MDELFIVNKTNKLVRLSFQWMTSPEVQFSFWLQLLVAFSHFTLSYLKWRLQKFFRKLETKTRKSLCTHLVEKDARAWIIKTDLSKLIFFKNTSMTLLLRRNFLFGTRIQYDVWIIASVGFRLPLWPRTSLALYCESLSGTYRVVTGCSTWSCESSFRSDAVGRAASSSSGPGYFPSLSLDQLSHVRYRGQGDTGHNQRQVTKVRTRTSEKAEVDIQRALKSRQ